MQLHIFLAEIQPLLNSRSLAYIGEKLNEGTSITPSHLETQLQAAKLRSHNYTPQLQAATRGVLWKKVS